MMTSRLLKTGMSRTLTGPTTRAPRPPKLAGRPDQVVPLVAVAGTVAADAVRVAVAVEVELLSRLAPQRTIHRVLRSRVPKSTMTIPLPRPNSSGESAEDAINFRP